MEYNTKLVGMIEKLSIGLCKTLQKQNENEII
jgi:hypothetical protein